MSHLYKATEWEICGNWYCNDTEELGTSIAGKWWVPARILEITLTDYVKMLIDDFKVDKISYNKEADVLIFSWKSQAAMRKYKNWINAQARNKRYYI